MGITLDFVGEKPKTQVEKTKYKSGNWILVKIDNVDLCLDISDFQYILEQGIELLDYVGE